MLDRQAGSDGLPGAGFNRQWLQDVLYGKRLYSTEIMLDGVLQTCAAQDPNARIGGQTVNVAAACKGLAAWDGRNRTDTVGTGVTGELAYTVKVLGENGIPLDRPWGQVQFEARKGEDIPIHGGSGGSGVYNAITPSTLVPNVGYTSGLLPLAGAVDRVFGAAREAVTPPRGPRQSPQYLTWA